MPLSWQHFRYLFFSESYPIKLKKAFYKLQFESYRFLKVDPNYQLKDFTLHVLDGFDNNLLPTFSYMD